MKINQEMIEQNIGWLIVLVILVVSVGGLAEIVPLYFQKSTTEPVKGLMPYTALQLTGRDIIHANQVVPCARDRRGGCAREGVLCGVAVGRETGERELAGVAAQLQIKPGGIRAVDRDEGLVAGD